MASGGHKFDFGKITENTLAAFVDKVERRVMPEAEALIEEKMSERPSSSDSLDRLVDEKLRGQFVTHKDLELILMKKCAVCQDVEGPIGKAATTLNSALGEVRKTVDGIVKQVSEWRGEKRNNGLWLKTMVVFASVVLAALLGLAGNRMNDMHREQMAKQQELANQISVALARLQNSRPQP